MRRTKQARGLSALAVLVGAAGLTAGVALAEGPAGEASEKAEAAKEAEHGKADEEHGKADEEHGKADEEHGIAEALKLPLIAKKTRDRGVPTHEVRDALRALHKAKVAPSESAETLESTIAAVEEKGPIDKFGAFVHEKLEAGLRGKDLAEAIRAEHETRGIGKGKKLPDPERGKHGHAGHEGKGDEHGEMADEHGEGHEHGEAAEHGEHGEHGEGHEHGEAAEHGHGDKGKPEAPGGAGKGKPGESEKAASKGKPGGSEKAASKGKPGGSEKAASKGKGK